MREFDVTFGRGGPPPPFSPPPLVPPSPNPFYSPMNESDMTCCRVGAALLRGQYEEAVQLIMQPRDGEREESAEARRLYLDKGASACMWAEKKREQKDFALLRQFNEKPSIVPGCPACLRVQCCTSVLCSCWPAFACILAV